MTEDKNQTVDESRPWYVGFVIDGKACALHWSVDQDYQTMRSRLEGYCQRKRITKAMTLRTFRLPPGSPEPVVRGIGEVVPRDGKSVYDWPEGQVFEQLERRG